jgi:hypothetical protein
MGYELFYFIGAIVLLAAIGYGVYRDKTRNRRNDALTDAATREQYQHPKRYQETQKAFEDAAKD